MILIVIVLNIRQQLDYVHGRFMLLNPKTNIKPKKNLEVTSVKINMKGKLYPKKISLQINKMNFQMK